LTTCTGHSLLLPLVDQPGVQVIGVLDLHRHEPRPLWCTACARRRGVAVDGLEHRPAGRWLAVLSDDVWRYRDCSSCATPLVFAGLPPSGQRLAAVVSAHMALADAAEQLVPGLLLSEQERAHERRCRCRTCAALRGPAAALAVALDGLAAVRLKWCAALGIEP